MSCQLKLCFETSPPRLIKTEFYNAETNTIHKCIRGNSAGRNREIGTFQWGAATEALSILALVYSTDGKSALEGELGSKAASLVFAISRNNSWVREMFGLTDIRKLFRVSNPQCKRSGPTAITFNDKLLSGSQVLILDNGNRPLNKNVRARILDELQKPKVRKFRTKHSEHGYQLKHWNLKDVFESEMLKTLYMTQIGSAEYLISQLRQISKDKLLASYSPSSVDLSKLYYNMRPILGKIDSSYGFSGDTKQTNEAFKIAIQPSFFSTIGIFSALKMNSGINLDLSFDYLHSKDLYDKVINSTDKQDVDALVISFATAVKEGLFCSRSKNRYFPLCIMPQSTHQVIAPAGGKSKTRRLGFGEYNFMSENPGTASLYFNELNEKGYINKGRIKIKHAEPHEFSSLFTSGDNTTRAISWFPHYQLHLKYNNCIVLDGVKNSLVHQGSVFLISEKHLKTPLPSLLLRLIRRAWKDLLHSSTLRAKIISDTLANNEYTEAVLKGSGIERPLLNVSLDSVYSESNSLEI